MPRKKAKHQDAHDLQLETIVPDRGTFISDTAPFVLQLWEEDPATNTPIDLYKRFPEHTTLDEALDVVRQYSLEDYCRLFKLVELEVYGSAIKYLVTICGEPHPTGIPFWIRTNGNSITAVGP